MQEYLVALPRNLRALFDQQETTHGKQ
jgi:hypothetical protein